MLRDSSGISSNYVLLIPLTAALILYLASQRYQKGLNKYQGPFLASLTNNWRLVDVWKRDAHTTFRNLHQKYGHIVRVAPNVLSFGHPAAISDIYGLNKGYTKVGRLEIMRMPMLTSPVERILRRLCYLEQRQHYLQSVS
jgi:hypothetical protein